VHTKGLSVVVPVFNEEENIRHSYAEISQVLNKMNCQYEIIYVDDGSRDSTLQLLADISYKDSNVRVVEFRRNFGQTAAMAAGFDHARYDIVVALDGDLQNDPNEIPKMVDKLNEGYDLVAGWRKERKDKFISRKLPSMLANWLISKTTNVQLHDYGCTLKVMTREIAQGIKLYGEMHRFIPALADEIGARIAEIPVNHRERKFGKSKYGISRTLRVILDLITVKFLLGYSKRPIHLFGSLGLVSSGVGGALLAWLTYERMFQHVPMGNRPLLSLGVMLVIIGLQFLVFGLLAEVLARTYYESQEKPIYVVRRVIEHSNKTTPISSGSQVRLARKAAI
jgi:glycosyltransferase involved in cell wall biosynthesis